MDREISHLDYNLQLCDSCKSALKLNRLLIVTARKRSLGQGNVFTQVCVLFCSQGVGFPACITGHMTIRVRIQGVSASRGRGLHPEVGRTPQPKYYGIQSTGGRYASYWNAFLFTIYFHSKLYKNAKLAMVYITGKLDYWTDLQEKSTACLCHLLCLQ